MVPTTRVTNPSFYGNQQLETGRGSLVVGTPSCTLYIALLAPLAPKHVETLKVAPLVVGTRGGVGAIKIGVVSLLLVPGIGWAP